MEAKVSAGMFDVAVSEAAAHYDAMARRLRIMARSPGSRAVQAVLKQLHLLKKYGVQVEAVFLKIPDSGPGSAVMRRFAEVYGVDAAMKNVRILDNSDLAQAYETIIFGDTAVWTGKRLNAWFSAKPEDGHLVMSDRAETAQATHMANYVFEHVWNELTQQIPPPASVRRLLGK